MGDNLDDEVKEVFMQDGVLLLSAAASFISYVKSVGTLILTEYSDGTKCVEWKPIDVTVDSEIQDQEWAVVNAVEKRIRTLSGSVPPEYKNRSKYLRINFEEIKSFRISDKSRRLTLNDGKSEPIITYLFQNGNCDHFVTSLKKLTVTVPAKRDKSLFIIVDMCNPEHKRIDKSVAELNMGTDGSLWNLLGNFQERPVITTLEAFSKITDYVYRSPEHREMDDDVKEILSKSITECESNTTTQSQGDYEVIDDIPDLPTRRDFPRNNPLSLEQWKGVQDNEGRIVDSECLKLLIFNGGVSPSLRQEVWKYILDYLPWHYSNAERELLIDRKNNEYYKMKLQWKCMSKEQEDNFRDFKERKSQIEKDVSRTDRTMDFYAGGDNPNLKILHDVLMTYVMYNFDVGYVQGMSDLLSPILHLMKDEVDSFWCFVGFMNKISANFDPDQVGMKRQLANLYTILAFIDPPLANHFSKNDSSNMFFCFRWLIVWFKRELNEDDCMSIWEVLWTGFPCENFHLLCCCAILTQERRALMDNNYGFTEILKHINDLCGKLDYAKILNDAQGIYYQIKESDQLTDIIRVLIGIPINSSIDNRETSPFEENLVELTQSTEASRLDVDEIDYEKSLSTNFL